MMNRVGHTISDVSVVKIGVLGEAYEMILRKGLLWGKVEELKKLKNSNTIKQKRFRIV